ncbi:MAG: integrase arm-type DNA-binding domain-containing protein [Xanthobacteraceae bacterium]
MRRLLTDRFCAGAKPRDGEVQTDYFDTQVSGLALRISEGRKSWTLHYTLGGKRRRLTFGNYPSISLSAARTRADEAKAAVADGHDPSLTATETLKDICELYLSREGDKLRNVKWRKGVLDRHVYPTLGARPIAEIRRSEIVKLLDRIEEGSGAAMATQTLALVRKVMNWHAARSDDFMSPVVRGMARTQRSEQARDRTLSDDEIRKIWTADNGVFSRYVRFLLLTAARRNEASEMTWPEIDGADWTLPAARNKTKVDLVRPLSRQAKAILAALPKDGKFVWSTNGGAVPIGGFTQFKQRFDAVSGTKGWTLHDLRRTARSLMSRAGVPSDHAERCLGHVIGGVRGVYDRHEYHREKAQAFEMLAQEIARIVSGGSAKVVPMRGKR